MSDITVTIEKLSGEKNQKQYSLKHLDGIALAKNAMKSACYNLLIEEDDDTLDNAVKIEIEFKQTEENGR